MIPNYLKLFIIIFIAGCTSDNEIHPDLSRFPDDDEVNHFVDISSENFSLLPGFFDPDNLHEIFTIGNDSTLANDYYKTPSKVGYWP